ncbi:MAG: hypothetical protein AAGE80_09060 [Pseudomonadota bacterium]
MTITMPVFVLASAACYSVCMIAMKFWGQGPTALIGLVILATMALGILMEIEALKVERIGFIYVAILGLEVLIIAAASYWLFGEHFTAKEIAGGVLILIGTALAWT